MSIIPSIGFIPFGSALPLRRLFKSPANKCSIDSSFEWTHRVRTPKTPTPTTKSSDSLICPCCRSTTMASAADREDAPGFTEIAVIRHGETSCNASRIIQEHLDSDLNEIGRHQAIAVADRLSKEPKFAAIYSSDLKRAAETANIIADICALPEVILDSALRERHLGDLQGLNLHDAKKLKPEAYKKFLSSKREGEIPEKE
ncbi:phosphoglycerate mutase-like protein 4 [Canna indica]|uniref:Phosphoglycerate mutase-like protein 4 n=1 Tax=Canna indica TaxID=4628 RepID=A0AAQ3QF75_9LILI|nr:phosphoglycerate mutase-like protein 4 [Canna indica]